MFYEKMMQIIEEVETNLLSQVKDNEEVIRIPHKVEFNKDGNLNSFYGTNITPLEEYYMDNDKTIQILNEIEKVLLSKVNENEAVFRFPTKVEFYSGGGIKTSYGVDTEQLFEKYYK